MYNIIYAWLHIYICIYNTAVLIKICRFWINVVKFIYANHYEIGPSNASQWQRKGRNGINKKSDTRCDQRPASDQRAYYLINKMDNKLLYDHLICHDIDYFHVSIVDMIRIGNNTESQLDELLSRKERKWIWDLCSITPYGLNQVDGYYCQNKRCRKR